MIRTHEAGAGQEVRVPADGISLAGTLALPPGAAGVVLFAHGSGSGRHSPRNRFVARALHDVGLRTLLLDLLTPEEEASDASDAYPRFDVGLLAGCLVAATDWLAHNPDTAGLPVGYFGASTGAAAALVAAAARPGVVRAVVSRVGRPDLAGEALPFVQAPTLLVVGGADYAVIGLNEAAQRRLNPAVGRRLEIVPGAGHLFEEPGALEEVAGLAADWFARHLAPADAGTP